MAALMETMMISIQTCWMMSCKSLIEMAKRMFHNLEYHMRQEVRRRGRKPSFFHKVLKMGCDEPDDVPEVC